MPALSSEEKRRFIEALERDREFRLAVMGLLGFKELLERFSHLEERQQRLEERFAELEARFSRLEERQQKLEERFARLEERFARLEEEFLELRKRQQALEERFLKLEERVTRLEESHQLLWREVKRLGATVGAIGRRFGKQYEALYREGVRELLQLLGVREYEVKHFKYVDKEGRYLHPGGVLELDMVIMDGELWILEIKSSVDPEDVTWFVQKTELAEKILGRKASRRIILAVIIDREALQLARSQGIEVIYITLIE